MITECPVQAKHRSIARFNGEMIPGCPLSVNAHEAYEFDLEDGRTICANEPFKFDLRLPGGRRDLLNVGVLG